MVLNATGQRIPRNGSVHEGRAVRDPFVALQAFKQYSPFLSGHSIFS